jgi:hypothetical protein
VLSVEGSAAAVVIAAKIAAWKMVVKYIVKGQRINMYWLKEIEKGANVE